MDTLGNLANFVKNHKKDFDEAEQLYRRALEIDPEFPGIRQAIVDAGGKVPRSSPP